MRTSRRIRLALVAVAALGGMVTVSGCTTASQSVGTQGTDATSGTAGFDVASVPKDAALAALVPAAIKSVGTLTVGSDTTFAPAEFLGGANGQTPMGFDVDFANAIGATLGLKVDFETAGFTTILPSLGAKYDLGISAFSITKERMKAVNFVDYYAAGSVFAVQKGNPRNISVDDLCGKNVGVQTGSTQADPDLSGRSAACVKAGKPAIVVTSLPTQSDITTRLVSGGIDAMVSGSTTIGYALTQTSGQLELLGKQYSPTPVGIAVAKNDMPLANLVAKVMNKFIADGTYAKIMDRWGVGVLAIKTAVVNPEAAQ